LHQKGRCGSDTGKLIGLNMLNRIPLTALAGKPNSGKSSLFNVLTGLHQKVGNFTGVTVDKASGYIQYPEMENRPLIDLPGTYSLFPKSEDERVTTYILTHPEAPDYPDQVLVVADASNMRNSLLLCTQIMDLALPVALVINMTDLLIEKGIRIHYDKLSDELGIPVLPVSVRRGKGIAEVKNIIAKGFPIPVRSFYKQIQTEKSDLNQRNDAPVALSDYQKFLRKSENLRYAEPFEFDRMEAEMIQDTLDRYQFIDALLSRVTEKTKLESKHSKLHPADRLLIHPTGGYILFFLLLGIMFQAIFAWAQWPMEKIESIFSFLGDSISEQLPQGFLNDLFVNGILAGLGGIVMFIPQIAFLFLFIAVLEESGYMARVVFLMDKIMRQFGMNGRSVIPLIGGMACAIPSIMSARGIPGRKERLITILVTPLMSCSARIPVYTLLIALVIPEVYIFGFINIQGLVMLGLYVAGFIMALVVARILQGRMENDSSQFFLIELPLYRMPRFQNLVLVVYHKCKAFVWEAGRIILVISIILWYLVSFGPENSRAEVSEDFNNPEWKVQLPEAEREAQKNAALLEVSYAGYLGKVIEPVIRPLGFDWKIGIGLIASFAAREVFVGTMATIYASAGTEEDTGSIRVRMQEEKFQDTGKPVYTLATGISLLVFYAFAMQCMSTLAITRRETGSWKWPLFMLGYLTVLAYVAALLAQFLLS